MSYLVEHYIPFNLITFCLISLGILIILGIIIFLGYLLLNYSINVNKKGSKGLFLTKKFKKKDTTLERHEQNPVISPTFREWETVGTFNPAVVKDDEGFVHLLYRAIGNDGLSRIGYAKSEDGLKFTDRTTYPIYLSAPSKKKEDKKNNPQSYNQKIYTSGGGWGGCEDPRAVVIDDCVYMTYTAFEGWDSVRMALTSISMKDLKDGHWNWKRPRFISSPEEVNKNWVLFPEKVNGKFAVLHSVSPEIKIDYLDSLYDEDGKHIKSSPPSGGRGQYWDNWMRGAGPPPIKTDIGWLLLYHAMDKKDPNKYKLGCMILDYDEPTKVLYRSPKPILEPNMPYENDWKPGVIYASGALIEKDDLVVYYGGGDKHICVAKTPLKPLLDWLVTSGKI